MSDFFNRINVRYVDHFAVTTRNFNGVVQDWMSMPGSKLLRGPGENIRQKVKYAFIQLSNGSTIEVLSPLTEDSPITSHVSNGGGVNHVCFAVDNISNSLKLAKKNGAIIIVEPIKDVAFDERYISFIMHPDHGLIELVETQPLFDQNTDSSQQSVVINDIDGNIEENVVAVINNIFPDTKNLTREKLAYGCVDKWDSLGQLQVVMAIEQEFDVNIPVERVVSMHSFLDIVNFLSAK